MESISLRNVRALKGHNILLKSCVPLKFERFSICCIKPSEILKLQFEIKYLWVLYCLESSPGICERYDLRALNSLKSFERSIVKQNL